jgi:nucleoside-triphosphatase THEP1
VLTNEAPINAVERNSHNMYADMDPDSTDVGWQSQYCAADRIYSRGASTYRRAGWLAPLPLPPGDKFPPPKGWTGREGRWPDDQQIDLWTSQSDPLSNLALRLSYDLVGIDVDAYEGKTGGHTLKEAESRWGPLPPTCRSTSRLEDGVSGIRIFRVPTDAVFRTVIHFKELGLADIEIVQPHQRYVVAWPSIHPKTRHRYRWFSPDGNLLQEGEVPRVEDLADLPEEWVVGLAKDAVREEVFDGSAPNRPREEDAVVDEEVYERLTDLTDDGAPDSAVEPRLQTALLELTNCSGSRYDAARDHVAALMRYRYLGRRGVPNALAQLFSAYVVEVGDNRPRQVAEAEFKRFTEGAALLVASNQVSDPWTALGMGSPGTETTVEEPGEAKRAEWDDRMRAGGSFILDIPDDAESLWGNGDRVIWASGEGLMITGTQGVGKTTLAQQLVLAMLGVLHGSVLGQPLRTKRRRVLYLAMDRPNQISRAFRRQCRDEHRQVLDENLVVWQGPPPADLAKHTELLTSLAERAKADVVVVDSLKDAAVGLSEDEVGAGWNRAAQGLLATGRNLLVLHHRKKQGKNAKTGLDDVYGSTWLTSGMGSVILLDGNPGDPLVQFRHLKSPVSQVGPMKVRHDQATGLMTLAERDLLAEVQVEGLITVKQAANLLFGSTSRGDVEKARRELEKYSTAGKLVKKAEGRTTAYYSPFGAPPTCEE